MTEPAPHYTVLARRFRPQTFEEIVGQDRIGRALRNAIQAGRVAHAYLFTGARGVGKTSTARILAKALNCPNAQNAVPCNACDVCQSIAAGHDVDVLEIDGASNRGIDDIRSLRANVTVRPMRSPYKVYIIDEVHMLTKEAFNALLKTLEEPPAKVKFIFCTTEPNKVPDTILSRCQRFDFGTIAPASISARLRQIATAEGVAVDEAALELLARRAAGSMRDSQSLFDQLLAFGSERISVEDVHQLLGTAGDDRLLELFDAVIARRRDEVLRSLDAALNEGVQIGAFSDQLLLFLRDLLISAAGADTVPLESIAESQRVRLVQQAATWGLQTIAAALEILAATKARMQRVNYDRVLLELALVRLCTLEDLNDIGAVIASTRGGGGGGDETSRIPRRVTGPTHATQPSNPPPGPRQGNVAPSRTSIIPQTGESRGVEERAQDAVTAESASFSDNLAPPAFALAPETLAAFWSEVVAQLPDRLAGHLARIDRVAISGPNHLEILFSPSYVLSRQFCERPETAGRIAETASKVAGKPIEVSVMVFDNGGSATPHRTPPASESHQKPFHVERDPFVVQARDVFGGSVFDAREIHEPSAEGT